MEKYGSSNNEGMSRTKRNENIYNSSDMSNISVGANNNVSIISDAHKEINIDKIRRYLEENNKKEEYERRISLELPKEQTVTIVKKEEKDYDINSVLSKAKDGRESDYEKDRHRKINTKEIDILKAIKIREEEQKYIDEDTTDPIEELNTQERTLVDLISNIKTHDKGNQKDLFEELMGEDDSVLGAISDGIDKENLKEELLNMTQDLESFRQPSNEFTHEINDVKERLKQGITEEYEEEQTTNTKIDKSFYTNSITFDKKDFEGFDELEKEAKKSSIFTKIMIFLIIIILLITILMVVNYVFNLNLLKYLKLK